MRMQNFRDNNNFQDLFDDMPDMPVMSRSLGPPASSGEPPSSHAKPRDRSI
jgi:hypothetical protein